jgi:hypothetical protein
VCEMVPAIQTQLSLSGGNDGGAWTRDGSYDDHAAGAPLCSGLRASLEPFRATSRAVDREGNTVDFRLSNRRDVAAAKAFLRKAIKSQSSTPETVTLDGYAASHRAVREMTSDGELAENTKVRCSKYLNNQIEQGHRGVKLRHGPMLGLQRFNTAAIAIAGIELSRRIQKGQFNLGRLRLKDKSTPAVWNAVLAA